MVDKKENMNMYTYDVTDSTGYSNNNQSCPDEPDIEQYEEEEDEQPMALVVEDEEICQNFLQNQLKEMKIQTRCAASVEEAKKVYWELTNEGISIDIVFLDVYLKDNSTGIQFLKIIKENNWMDRALIIVMSGNEDNEIIKECYNYNIQNFLRKPITKASFFNEKFKIIKYLDSLKCPLSEFKIERKLGGGESGIVHLVRHKKTRELFALKTVVLDPTDKTNRKSREGGLHKNLKAPTILELRDYKIIDNNLYMVLEYAENGTLSYHIKEKIKKNDKFSVDNILDWAAELFLGLWFLHDKKLMHRDIKSDNLFICKKNVLKIGDLGISKAGVDYTKTVCGTVLYMAPEIFLYKEYYYTVDIWAAGVVLYELIMLKKPFEGSSSEEIQSKIQSGDYEALPEKTDERLKKLIKICLNLDPILRLSCKEIIQLDFMSERIIRLFENKTLVNDNIYFKLLSLFDKSNKTSSSKHTQNDKFNGCINDSNNTNNNDNNNNFNLPHDDTSLASLSPDDFQKIREYYLKFNLAFKIDSLAIKSTYKPGYFSNAICNVIKGSDLGICSFDMQISEDQMQDLINDEILVNVANPTSFELDLTDSAYYKVCLFDNEKIDNSIRFTIGVAPIVITDPVQLSLGCLAQAETLNKKIRQAEEQDNFDQNIADMLSSKSFVSFLHEIKKLKYLNMEKYTKAEKLAIILNIYQTMYIHLSIKSLMGDDQSNKNGLFDSLKSIFRRSKNVEIAYEISNQIVSMFEMKHIVIRRNRKPLTSYFRLASGGDPRIKFIDEGDNMLIKLHIVCLDPPSNNNYIENENPPEPRITQFKTETVYEQLDEHCKLWLSEYVKRDENQFLIPKLFKDYLYDFGKDEEEMLKTLFRLNFDPTIKLNTLVRQLKSKELIITYY